MNSFCFDDCVIRDATRSDIGGSLNVIRHKIVECENGRKYFLRLSRSIETQQPQYKENAAIDMFANVLAYKLAAKISADFPVAEQHFVITPAGVAGVLSPLLSAKHIGNTNGAKDMNVVNKELLPALFAFEQFIMNTDDKEEHFVLSPPDKTNGMGMKVLAIDHGHSINAWKDLNTMEKISTYSLITQPSSAYNPFKFTSITEAITGSNVVGNISVRQIDDALHETLKEMEEICGLVNEVSEFTKDVQKSEHVPRFILNQRKENIEAIIRTKCEKLNLK